MHALIYLPFFVQAVAIGLDEYLFHLKRGLPKWERIGHPIDTLSVIACFLFLLFVPYTPEMVKFYVGLSIFSCLMVTKDEFVHKHHCPAAEHWLHALLFLNHPILLACAGLLWAEAPLFLLSQTVLISLFFFYQVIYWNFIYAQDQ